MRAILIIWTIITIPDFVLSNSKLWLRTSNFEDPKNWNIGRPPCQEDKIVFPDTIPPVLVKIHTSIKEMVLPNNGEFILANSIYVAAILSDYESDHESNTTESIPDNDDSTEIDGSIEGSKIEQNKDNLKCGQTIEYIGDKPQSWFNPENWCTTAHIDGNCIIQPSLLDTERIPCEHDGVAFHEDNTFFVNLSSGIDIQIKALQVGTKVYNTGSFKQYLKTSKGKQEFHTDEKLGAATVNIMDEDCEDTTGCPCFNNYWKNIDVICSAKTHSCMDLPCKGIKPIGACCEVCGAVMELEFSSDFRFDFFKDMIYHRYMRSQDEVKTIISKASHHLIQVVLYDHEDGTNSQALGKKINDDLSKDMREREKYGIIDIVMKKSTTSNPDAGHLTGDSKISTTSVILILFLFVVLIAILIISYTVVINRKRLNVRKFLSKRNKSSSDMELESNVEYRNGAVSYSDMFSQFDNPMFGSLDALDLDSMRDNLEIPHSVKLCTVDTESSGFSNPLYGKGPIEEIEHYNETSLSANVIKFNEPIYKADDVKQETSNEGIDENSNSLIMIDNDNKNPFKLPKRNSQPPCGREFLIDNDILDLMQPTESEVNDEIYDSNENSKRNSSIIGKRLTKNATEDSDENPPKVPPRRFSADLTEKDTAESPAKIKEDASQSHTEAKEDASQSHTEAKDLKQVSDSKSKKKNIFRRRLSRDKVNVDESIEEVLEEEPKDRTNISDHEIVNEDKAVDDTKRRGSHDRNKLSSMWNLGKSALNDKLFNGITRLVEEVDTLDNSIEESEETVPEENLSAGINNPMYDVQISNDEENSNGLSNPLYEDNF